MCIFSWSQKLRYWWKLFTSQPREPTSILCSLIHSHGPCQLSYDLQCNTTSCYGTYLHNKMCVTLDKSISSRKRQLFLIQQYLIWLPYFQVCLFILQCSSARCLFTWASNSVRKPYSPKIKIDCSFCAENGRFSFRRAWKQRMAIVIAPALREQKLTLEKIMCRSFLSLSKMSSALLKRLGPRIL